MSNRATGLRSRIKPWWLSHSNKAQNAVGHAPVASINLGCDNNFTVLNDHDQFLSHIAEHPPLKSSYSSRLFSYATLQRLSDVAVISNINLSNSYSTQMPMSQLLAIYDDFGFIKLGSYPAGLDKYDATPQPDYATNLCDVCSCSSCSSGNECGRVILTATFGILEAQTKDDWAPGEDKQLNEVGQKPSEYVYAGSQIKFPGATTGVITFGLRLAKFRMICYKDGQQLRRLEAFHYGSKILEVMHNEPIDYVIAQIKELEACWNETIRKCKSVLADVNRGVLEESFGEIDRKLVRGLYKYAQTWEELRRVHTQQLDALQHLMQDGAEGIWFRTNQAAEPERGNDRLENVRALLESFSVIEAKIKKDLVEETSELISRTHSIISIDEAYRSRDQNESVKRLSWITFIFLPLLFVASLFGMNVDLVENNPSWIYYIYISIPMFLSLLLSVWILKQLKGFIRAVSGWVDGTRNKYTPVLSQRMGNDEETKYGSNNENTSGLDYAAAIGDADAVRGAVGEIGDAKRLCANAMRLAAENGHQKVVENLLDGGADIEGRSGRAGRTPLQIAASSGHLPVVKLLLDRQADVNADPERVAGRTALQAAAGGGHLSVVEYLLAQGAVVDAAPAMIHGVTALQAAAGAGHLSVVEYLLAQGAVVDAAPAMIHGVTALQAAAGGGHLSVVEFLFDRQADVNADPGSVAGRTALQAAAGAGHLSVVEYLLAQGAVVDAAPAMIHGVTALQAAAGTGHLSVVEYLLAQGAVVDAARVESNGWTVLQAAAGSGHLSAIEHVLGQRAVVDAAPARVRNLIAFHAAFRFLSDVEYLRAEEEMVDAGPGQSGWTALQAAAGGGHLSVVEYFLAKEAMVDAAPGESDGWTALQAAAGGGHLSVVEYLLAKGASVDAAPYQYRGRTALQAAAGGGHLSVVEYLLARGAEVDEAPGDSKGRTALQAAAGSGHLSVVEYLITQGAAVDKAPGNSEGRTALQAAAGGGHLSVVEYLITQGAAVDKAPGNSEGRTALQAAAGGGHLSVVEYLVARGAEVYEAPGDSKGRTALQAAAGGGHLSVVEYLVARGADLNAPAGNQGETVLGAAAGGGHASVVQYLLARGTDVNTPAGVRGQTALDAADGGGHQAIVNIMRATRVRE